MSPYRFLIVHLFALAPLILRGQERPANNNLSVPDAYYTGIAAKADKFNTRVNRYSEKALRRLERQEEKIKRKLQKIDSAAASKLFSAGDSLKKLGADIKRT